jgi:uncharacterized RDD family membrane protein YckC
MSAQAPRLTIASVTGVEVDLRIAGPGSRSYAFTIDWHIRLIFALCWFFIGTFAITRSWTLQVGERGGGSTYAFTVLIPALAIYLLYHPVLEVIMHGRTPGKRMAGVRIVTRTGDVPTPGALLVRNVFRIIDSLPVFYVVGLACVVFTQQHTRIGDLAAGTLLVFDTAESDDSLASLSVPTASNFNPATTELARELLDRWAQLAPEARSHLARQLLLRANPSLTSAQLEQETADQLRTRVQQFIAGEA